MEEFEQCPICCGTFSSVTSEESGLTPIVGVCGHTICRKCLTKMHLTKIEAAREGVSKNIKNMNCPLCHQPKMFRSDKMNPNFLLCAAIKKCHALKQQPEEHPVPVKSEPTATNDGGDDKEEEEDKMGKKENKNGITQDEAAARKRPKVDDLRGPADVLNKYLTNDETSQEKVPRRNVDWHTSFELVPNRYGGYGYIRPTNPWRETELSYAFASFVGEVGWLATHLMLSPYTRYGIINETILRQALETIVHPKHWSWRCEDLKEYLPGSLPAPFYPKTLKERVMYIGKNMKVGEKSPNRESEAQKEEQAHKEELEERKRIAATGDEKKDPDYVIRAAADAGVYIHKLTRGCVVAGFTGDIAAVKIGFDEEKDRKDRQKLHQYLRVVCQEGSRKLFERLTPSDKGQIDSLVGRPGYSDLPALLETSVTGTGAEEFDKVFPLPPPEYRLDPCAMIPYLYGYLMHDRVGWGSAMNALTPGATVILNAAVSAVLYKAYQNVQLKKDN